MTKELKSALHDAVPSWNGFNYQGKIGLYVCLKLILEKLSIFEPSSQEFIKYIDSHSIEYEWIEDFSIKSKENYISLHQVKHKAGTTFSDHIDAIATILNRKLGILSGKDLLKYIDIEECNETKINNLFDQLKDLRYLDANHRLEKNWREVKTQIDDIEPCQIQKLLSEFESFSDVVFTNSKVYFHTAESVSKPTKMINTYSGIPEHHHEYLNDMKTLSSLNIFLGFDDQDTYELVLGDKELLECIKRKVINILKIIFPNEIFSDEQVLIYQAILLKIIDTHIIERHNNIRLKKNIGSGFNEHREVLFFRDLFKPLQVLIQEHNENYWNSFCMQCFEEAFVDEISKLEHYIFTNRNRTSNINKKKRLEEFRIKILKNHTYTTLLSKLSPDKDKLKNVSIFFNDIANKDSIKKIFLYFVQNLNSEEVDFIVSKDDGYRYHPSIISFNAEDEDDWDYYLQICKNNIEKNNKLKSLFEATHLVVKTADGHDITNQPVKLKSLLESIDEEIDQNSKDRITEFNTISFISLKNAIKVINDE